MPCRSHLERFALVPPGRTWTAGRPGTGRDRSCSSRRIQAARRCRRGNSRRPPGSRNASDHQGGRHAREVGVRRGVDRGHHVRDRLRAAGPFSCVSGGNGSGSRPPGCCPCPRSSRPSPYSYLQEAVVLVEVAREEPLVHRFDDQGRGRRMLVDEHSAPCADAGSPIFWNTFMATRSWRLLGSCVLLRRTTDFRPSSVWFGVTIEVDAQSGLGPAAAAQAARSDADVLDGHAVPRDVVG